MSTEKIPDILESLRDQAAPGVPLELRTTEGGLRHYVGNVPVSCGRFLEVELGGKWVTVRYEANFWWENDTPKISFSLIAWGGRVIPDRDAKFRWPND